MAAGPSTFPAHPVLPGPVAERRDAGRRGTRDRGGPAAGRADPRRHGGGAHRTQPPRDADRPLRRSPPGGRGRPGALGQPPIGRVPAARRHPGADPRRDRHVRDPRRRPPSGPRPRPVVAGRGRPSPAGLRSRRRRLPRRAVLPGRASRGTPRPFPRPPRPGGLHQRKRRYAEEHPSDLRGLGQHRPVRGERRTGRAAGVPRRDAPQPHHRRHGGRGAGRRRPGPPASGLRRPESAAGLRGPRRHRHLSGRSAPVPAHGTAGRHTGPRAGPRPGHRRGRPVVAAPRRLQRHPRRAAPDRRGPAGVRPGARPAVRHHRGRRHQQSEPVRPPGTRTPGQRGAAAALGGGGGARTRHRRPGAARGGRGDLGTRLHGHGRLPERPGADRPRPAGRLAGHRRPRAPGPLRLSAADRPQRAGHQVRRPEDISRRGGARAALPSGGTACGRPRRTGSGPDRVRPRGRRVQGGPDLLRGGTAHPRRRAALPLHAPAEITFWDSMPLNERGKPDLACLRSGNRRQAYDGAPPKGTP